MLVSEMFSLMRKMLSPASKTFTGVLYTFVNCHCVNIVFGDFVDENGVQNSNGIQKIIDEAYNNVLDLLPKKSKAKYRPSRFETSRAIC